MRHQDVMEHGALFCVFILVCMALDVYDLIFGTLFWAIVQLGELFKILSSSSWFQ
jgi:hypothetical protein